MSFFILARSASVFWLKLNELFNPASVVNEPPHARYTYRPISKGDVGQREGRDLLRSPCKCLVFDPHILAHGVGQRVERRGGEERRGEERREGKGQEKGVGKRREEGKTEGRRG